MAKQRHSTRPTSAEELALLRRQFPGYELTVDIGRGRLRYISRSRQFGQNPHTVITGDPDELREVLRRAQAAERARLQAAFEPLPGQASGSGAADRYQ